MDVSSHKTKRAKARKGQPAPRPLTRVQSPDLPSQVGAQSIVDMLTRIRQHISDVRAVQQQRPGTSSAQLATLETLSTALRVTIQLAQSAGLSAISSSEEDGTGSGKLVPTTRLCSTRSGFLD